MKRCLEYVLFCIMGCGIGYAQGVYVMTVELDELVSDVQVSLDIGIECLEEKMNRNDLIAQGFIYPDCH